MERSNHRIRSLPTEELITELVVRLVDTMLDGKLERLESPRARRVFLELQKRERGSTLTSDDCTCADCLGDLYEPLLETFPELSDPF